MSETAQRSDLAEYNPDRDDVFINNGDGTWTTYSEGEVNIVDANGNILFNSPDGAATNDDDLLL